MPRLVIAVGMLVALGLAVGSASGAAGSPCGPDAARTVTADSQARVYVTGAGVYGCARPTGVPRQLGGSVSSCLGGARIGPVALAGVTAAFASERCGIDTGETSVLIRRLSDGRGLGRANAGNAAGAESYTTVSALVVRADGSAAWISVSRSIGTRVGAVEVWRIVHGRAQRLEAGHGIRAGSLRLRGRWISWRDSARTHSALLV